MIHVEGVIEIKHFDNVTVASLACQKIVRKYRKIKFEKYISKKETKRKQLLC